MKNYRILKIDTLKNTNIFRIIFNDLYTKSVVDIINVYKVVDKFCENFDERYESKYEVREINRKTAVDINLKIKVNY